MEFRKLSRAWLTEEGRCRKGDQLEDTVLAKAQGQEARWSMWGGAIPCMWPGLWEAGP